MKQLLTMLLANKTLIEEITQLKEEIAKLKERHERLFRAYLEGHGLNREEIDCEVQKKKDFGEI